MKNTLVIASRESQLAMWQACFIRDQLQMLYPTFEIKILGMTTQGDQILDKTLSKIGGKGLFVKELETALLEGRADLAVHSMKDVPMLLPEGLAIAAISQREIPYDAFVSNHYPHLANLPDGAVVGTSSLRREAQLRSHYPNLIVKPLRGNVQTRLSKLDQGDYDAIILAAAGLIRLGLEERIACSLSAEESLPAAGQGALGIEICADNLALKAMLEPLNHLETACCVRAERMLSRQFGGSCQIPLGAFAEIKSSQLYLRALLALPDGTRRLWVEGIGELVAPEALGSQLAEQLYAQGAQLILDQIAEFSN